eukprot:scaffold6812_cov85-Isochrysis_galbana.AAC.1
MGLRSVGGGGQRRTEREAGYEVPARSGPASPASLSQPAAPPQPPLRRHTGTGCRAQGTYKAPTQGYGPRLTS